MMPEVKIMQSDKEIMLTFHTVKQLRPHLDQTEYITKIRRLMERHDYTLIAVVDENEVMAVAGYRITESLAWDQYLYVDDFITNESNRKNGYAQILWNWLIAEALKKGCKQFHLDSGVNRFDAHRFYLKNGLDITCHHFQKNID
ncbi:GNAT superfamily N-acetyltransferase [Bacillus sp. OAE603]